MLMTVRIVGAIHCIKLLIKVSTTIAVHQSCEQSDPINQTIEQKQCEEQPAQWETIHTTYIIHDPITTLIDIFKLLFSFSTCNSSGVLSIDYEHDTIFFILVCYNKDFLYLRFYQSETDEIKFQMSIIYRSE